MKNTKETLATILKDNGFQIVIDDENMIVAGKYHSNFIISTSDERKTALGMLHLAKDLTVSEAMAHIGPARAEELHVKELSKDDVAQVRKDAEDYVSSIRSAALYMAHAVFDSETFSKAEVICNERY